MPSGWGVVLGLVLVATTAGGCATAPIPPAYTKDELKAICERQGGWWRPNILDGYCEGNSQI
jgi:hypothetical protein